MGSEPDRTSMMTKSFWRLVEVLTGALDQGEREAVLGDFAESGESGSRVLLGTFGLVARREAARWANWRPWAILLALIIPFSTLISVLSRMVSDETQVYVWMYVNNWDWDFSRNAGFWYELASAAFVVLRKYLTLACWSWVIGCAIGLVSRRTVRANGFLFCFMLLLGEAVVAPLYLAYFFRSIGRPAPIVSNDPVFELAFYRVVFPLIVQIGLVAVPAFWGVRQGERARAHGKAVRIGLSVAAVVTLVAIVIQEPGFPSLIKAYERPWIWRSWEMQMLPLVAYWPVAYLLGNTVFARFQKGSSAESLR